MMSQKLRVTVWGENVHEHENPLVAKIYPDGMHRTIADAIAEEGNCEVRTATLQDPEHGLTDRRSRKYRCPGLVGPRCPQQSR